MTKAEIVGLGDRFSSEVLLKGVTPLTVRALVEALAALGPPVLASRKTFLVAEGAQARLKNRAFELNARLVMVWQAAGGKPDLMLSTVPAADNPFALMQLAAWSERDRAFHYFERVRESGQWTWAGNSFHALDPRSRGRGPFDSHINGSLVMKELKAPWTHWHSVDASIPPESFDAVSELRTEPLFADIESAHLLEPIVETGIRRWTSSRFDSLVSSSALRDLPSAMRQVLWCTSINLVSSSRVFGQPAAGRYPLPVTFFYDFDAFAFLSQEIDGGGDLVPPGNLDVDAALYDAAVVELGLSVADDSVNPVIVSGDTHFAFLVPERAFEDLAVVRELVGRGALSARTALCLLLVDFTNPVFSPRRGALLAHVPATTPVGDGGAGFDAAFLAAVRLAAANDSATPEAELVALIDHPDLLTEVGDRLRAFDAALRATLASAAGVRAIVELADSRRRTLADKRTLAEFRSTMAFGTNPKDHLAMAPDATVFIKQSDLGEDER